MTTGSPADLTVDKDPDAALSLWDYRRRVAELYAEVRRRSPAVGWVYWIERRDELLRTHPQSPIPAANRRSFTGLPYFPYDPALRVLATVEPAPEQRLTLPHSGDGETGARSIGVVHFTVPTGSGSLTLFWLDDYAGGLFVPFRDATSGESTYGGGRYLLDTAKGADLGHEGNRITLDFNFAFHPSCVHDPRWSCPLAPPSNRLTVPITGGERLAPRQ